MINLTVSVTTHVNVPKSDKTHVLPDWPHTTFEVLVPASRMTSLVGCAYGLNTPAVET